MEYGKGTSLTPASGSFATGYVAARALCADGKVRNVRFTGGGIPDTFFSTPCSVSVHGKTVSGYITVETYFGYSTPTVCDPACVKFMPYTYGKNCKELPQW